MRGGLPEREDEITVNVPVNGEGAFDPSGTKAPKTYRLAFSVRELGRAERHFKQKALAPGAVGLIVDRLLDGSLDNFTLCLYYMLERYHPKVTEAEVYAVLEADFDRVEALMYEVMGRTLPEAKEPDPKALMAPAKAPKSRQSQPPSAVS